MSSLTSVITTITTTYIPAMLTAITSSDVLMVGIGFFVCGGVIGLIKRAFHAH